MTCIICGHPNPSMGNGWLICGRDYWRTHRALVAIPTLAAELATLGPTARDRIGPRPDGTHHHDPVANTLTAGPLNAPARGPNVSGTRDHPLPVNVTVVDLLGPSRPASWLLAGPDQTGNLAVATELEYIARNWAEPRRDPLPHPTIPTLCGWLLVRLDWAAAHAPTLADDVATIGRLNTVLMAACGRWQSRPEPLVAPCKACGMVTLYRMLGDDNEGDRVACGNCPNLLTDAEYTAWCQELIAHTRSNTHAHHPRNRAV